MAKPEFDEQETGNKFADGLIMPIFAVGAVFLFVILCFYAYDHVMKNKKSGDVVVLDADNSSFKVAPQDPGGMQVEHTDKAVFNTVTGEKENIGASKVNVQSQEAPVSQEQLENSADGNKVSINIPSEPGKTSTVTINPDEVDAPKEPSAPATAMLNANSKDMPGNSGVSVTSGNKSAPSPTIKEDDQIDEASAAMADDEGDVKANTKLDTKAAPVKITPPAPIALTPAKTIQADVKKETNKATGESKTIVNFHDAPKAAVKTPAATASSGKYFVQISAHSSKSEAESAWKSFSAKNAAEISKYGKNISEAEVKGKTFYRLSFGPFADKSAASTQCGILKAKGQDCMIQKY